MHAHCFTLDALLIVCLGFSFFLIGEGWGGKHMMKLSDIIAISLPLSAAFHKLCLTFHDRLLYIPSDYCGITADCRWPDSFFFIYFSFWVKHLHFHDPPSPSIFCFGSHSEGWCFVIILHRLRIWFSLVWPIIFFLFVFRTDHSHCMVIYCTHLWVLSDPSTLINEPCGSECNIESARCIPA